MTADHHAPPRRTTSSAFSRLANIALSSTTTPATTTVATGGGESIGSTSSSAASPSTSASLPPAAALASPVPQSQQAPRALDALEHIVNADNHLGGGARKRHGSTDSRLSEVLQPPSSAGAGSGGGSTHATMPGGGGGVGGTTTTNRFKRGSWATNAARDSSHSRSRERERERERSDSSGFLSFGGGGRSDSPSGGGGGGGANRYWGMEVLPSNMSQNESHFFQPGAGSSGFSFEGHGSSSGVGSFWDGSYRSSITGSPSLFGSSVRVSSSTGGGGGGSIQPATATASTTNTPARYPWNSNVVESGGGGGSSSGSASSHLARPSRPLTRQPPSFDLSRSASPMGGGRKLKEYSRGLKHSLASSNSRDELKGLVGIAKPPRNGLVGNANDLGRVAVAGKHSLKILKVPHGPTSSSIASSYSTRRHPTTSSYATVARSSSIADRRSRSRGPQNGTAASSSSGSDGFVGGRRDGSADGVRSEDQDSGADKEDEVFTVEEVMDVRTGSRLSPSYLFQDVRWGYGATSNKLATACSNGAVILWDLGRDGGSKLDQVKYEHDRAVNRIVFGGQTGNWLMSGGQDGQMKLWDIRESRPSSMILKASSPVRHLSFSPSASQPFTLLAACASGTLIRYDVRYISRQNGGATDRIAGHIGSCLAMDWRDGYDCEKVAGGSTAGAAVGVSQETAGGGKEGGWVVTGGIDSTIKIWDFSLPTLATKPIRTLYPSQPVQSVSWHPTHGSELASAPLPSLSLGANSDKNDESIPIPPNPLSRSEGNVPTARGGSWKNEISIWDVRRPYFPKLSIKTDEPTSAILFNDDETIWTTSKTSNTFHQYDTASDSYSLLDCVDRPSTAWNLEGEFMFVDDSRTAYDVPFERSSRASVPVNSDKFVPEVYFAAVTDLDPDFSTESFTQLANNLQLTGDFDEICDHNTHVSFLAGRPDAAQVWAVVKTWFGRSPLSTPDSPPVTPPTEVEDGPARDEHSSPQVAPAPDWILSPTSTTYSDAASKSNRHHRFSLSSLRSSPSSRRQTSSDTFDSSTTALPKESVKQLLDTFSEESTASETDPLAHSPYYPELSSTSSDSESDVREEARRLHKASVASLPTNRLAASLAALADSQKHTGSELSLDDLHKHASRTPSRLGSRRNSTSSSASSSGSSESSSLSDHDAADGGGGKGAKRKSSRSAKIAALHASLIANRSRRPSAGQSSERRPLRSRDSTLPGSRAMASRKQSAEGNAVGNSRRGSATRRRNTAGNRSVSNSGVGAGCGAAKEEAKVNPTMSAQDFGRQAAAAHAEQAFGVVKQQLKATLIDYADRGDSQLCAVVCCVLQEQELGLDSLWVARVTKAYLDMLRRLDLHVPAAALNKYCSTEFLRNLTQDSVVFHTACGRCGKGIEQAPYDYCQKCRLIITRCGICHLAVTSMYIFCACCGHGLHEHCLQNFAGSHSSLAAAAASQPQTPNTVPSTPGIATPLRHWLYGSEGAASVADSEEEVNIYEQGPSTSQLSQYAGPSSELYGVEAEVPYQRQYPAASGLTASSCACSGCQQGGTHELYYPNPQQLPTTSYFPQNYLAPAPYLYATSPSTPYEYYDTSRTHYPLPQAFPRSDSALYHFDTASGTTTPLPTPPARSPCYFPASDSLYPLAAEPSLSLPRRQKSFTLPNPSPVLPSTPSFESSSVSRLAPSPSSEFLSPHSASRSLAPEIARRQRESSSHSTTLEPPTAVRRRSSTLSVRSPQDGPNSDNSDGGDIPERHETVTPFVSKLAHLLREGTPWIQWNAEGTAFFFAHHRDEFGDQLARVFRHGSSHSFVRQLNIYNFKRLAPAELEQTVEARREHVAPGLVANDFAAFAHPLFFRGATCDLAKIKPKTPRKASGKHQPPALLVGSGLAPKGSSPSLPSSSTSSSLSSPSTSHLLLKTPSPNRSLRSDGKVGGVPRTKY
ncbi:hypothetical protein JCM11491_006345 [Sporobolomyces phaffii]